MDETYVQKLKMAVHCHVGANEKDRDERSEFGAQFVGALIEPISA